MNAKFLTLKIILVVTLIILGNYFWFNLLDSLKNAHILTSSSFQVGLSLLIPIAIFSFYLSILILMSVFIKNRPLWFLAIFFSMIDYPYLTGGGLWATGGELAISAALFYFLISFHGGFTISKTKASTISQLQTAIGTPSLIITFILALNFYSIYNNTLTSSNILLSNQLLAKTLNPVVKVYLDDLHSKDPNERFDDYLLRQSQETQIPPSQIKTKVLERLNLTEATAGATIKDLIKASLNQSVLKIAKDYGKQVPILISLGLGVITQTLISFSSTMAGYITLGLLKVLGWLKFLKLEKTHLDVEKLISSE